MERREHEIEGKAVNREEPGERRAVVVPAASLSAFKTLGIRDFRFLLPSNSLTLAGQQLRLMAQGWLVLELTNQTVWVGLANGLPTLVGVPLAMLSGVMTDRANPRTLLLQVRVFLGLTAFAAAYMVGAGLIELWHVLLLAMAAGGLQAYGLPASQTFVYDLVGRDRLLGALALGSMLQYGSNLIAPPLAGYLMGRYGIEAGFYLLTFMFAVAVVSLLFVRGGKPAERPDKKPFVVEFVDGINYVRRAPHVAALLFLASLAVFGAAFLAILPAYARDVLHVGAGGFGLLTGAQGAGALITSLWLSRRGNISRKGRSVVMAGTVWGVGMVVFGLSRSYGLSLATLAIMGASTPFWLVALNTALQTTVPENMRGRVLAMYTTVFQTVPLGFVLGGLLSALMGEMAALLTCGTAFTILNVTAYAKSQALREV